MRITNEWAPIKSARRVTLMASLALSLLGASALPATAATPSPVIAPQTWISDPVGTWFEVFFNHSNLYDVTTIAPNTIATVTFKGDDITKAQFEISTAIGTLWAHNNLFAGAMKSDGFFNAETHPSVYFSSRQIERDGDGYRVTGDLNANGVTRSVALHMTASKIVPWDGVQFRAFTLKGYINKQDYGMTFQEPEGLKDDPLFGKKLGVKFNIEVTDKPNASPFGPPQVDTPIR